MSSDPTAPTPSFHSDPTAPIPLERTAQIPLQPQPIRPRPGRPLPPAGHQLVDRGHPPGPAPAVPSYGVPYQLQVGAPVPHPAAAEPPSAGPLLAVSIISMLFSLLLIGLPGLVCGLLATSDTDLSVKRRHLKVGWVLYAINAVLVLGMAVFIGAAAYHWLVSSPNGT